MYSGQKHKHITVLERTLVIEQSVWLEVEKWTPISSARVIVSAGAAPKKT
jgi:hypothetical protein